MNAITLGLLITTYYVDVEYIELKTEAQHRALALLRTDKLVTVNELTKTISIAERGVAHIEYLLNIPLPEEKKIWVHKLS